MENHPSRNRKQNSDVNVMINSTITELQLFQILCGTPANLAPEITGKKLYGPEVDVW